MKIKYCEMKFELKLVHAEFADDQQGRKEGVDQERVKMRQPGKE